MLFLNIYLGPLPSDCGILNLKSQSTNFKYKYRNYKKDFINILFVICTLIFVIYSINNSLS